MPALSKRAAGWLVRGAWLVGLGLLCGLWPALEMPGLITPPQMRLEAFVQLALLRGSWLLIPLLVQSGWKAFRRAAERRALRATGAGALAALCVVLLYARFIEPALLVVRTTVIPAPVNLDIALVSDFHIGRYTDTAKLRQVVARLNKLDVDLVLIAGDFTYGPPRDLAAAFAPLRHLDKPVYAVLGNHDVQLPGPPIAHQLEEALPNVHFIMHRVIDFPTFRLAGLYDWWSARDDTRFLKVLPPGKPLLVLMHQPHSLRALPGVRFALAMAGHTHGGQVAIPWLTDEVFLLTRDETHVDGLYDTTIGKLFVTRGVGITGFPVRFNCPPTIDVLELRDAAAGPAAAAHANHHAASSF